MKLHSYLALEIPSPLKERLINYAKELIYEEELIEPELWPHITIRNGILTNDPKEVASKLGKFFPIRITLGITTVFDADLSRPTDAVILDVRAPGAKRLRAQIENTLEVMPPQYYYRPHITLAFVPPKRGFKYLGSNPFIGDKIILDRVIFSPLEGNKSVITRHGEVYEY